jgi:hypothetical protein
MLLLELLTFAFARWLGLYLLARDVTNPRLRYAGLGLALYALAVAGISLAALAPGVARFTRPLLFLPAFFWFGAIVALLPETAVLRRRALPWLDVILLPAGILFYLLAAAGELIFVAGEPGRGYTIFAAVIMALLLAALLLIGRVWRSNRPRLPLGLIVAATLFFTLGAGLLLAPLAWPPRWLLVLAIGADLLLLGVAVAILDAFAEGEALLPDFLRSLGYSALTALFFGGQVGLAMAAGAGVTLPLLALLLAIVATAVFIQTFAAPLQTGIERVLFARFPGLQRERAELRAVAEAVPRRRQKPAFADMDEEAFTRLTRRALSHMGNLPKLAASPLTQLRLVEKRLQAREAPANTLNRARELRALLTESIARLKPRGPASFGATDEWRHYNALYWPYVAGLRPYSRRARHNDLDPTAAEALAWFQSQVPQRTLYNWQNAAAELVAQDLRERRHSSDAQVTPSRK